MVGARRNLATDPMQTKQTPLFTTLDDNHWEQRASTTSTTSRAIFSIQLFFSGDSSPRPPRYHQPSRREQGQENSQMGARSVCNFQSIFLVWSCVSRGKHDAHINFKIEFGRPYVSISISVFKRLLIALSLETQVHVMFSLPQPPIQTGLA